MVPTSRIYPDHIQSYFNRLVDSGRKTSTLKQYTSDLDKFLVWIEDKKGSIDLNEIKSLTELDYREYINHLLTCKHSDATIRRLLSVLKGFLAYQNIYIDFELDRSEIGTQRDLGEKDFVNNEEFDKLLKSMKTRDHATTPLGAARGILISRNVAILLLMRYYGFSPTDISLINMVDIQFPQNIVELPYDSGKRRKFALRAEHKKWILDYFTSIPKDRRPRYNSNDPLFVAYNNRHESYQYDYDLAMPKRLSVRAIQKMIKEEVLRVDLRKISAMNLRNQCILDSLTEGKPDESIILTFDLKNSFSLHRYKRYLKKKQNSNS